MQINPIIHRAFNIFLIALLAFLLQPYIVSYLIFKSGVLNFLGFGLIMAYLSYSFDRSEQDRTNFTLASIFVAIIFRVVDIFV